jgi:hypothetical protein
MSVCWLIVHTFWGHVLRSANKILVYSSFFIFGFIIESLPNRLIIKIVSWSKINQFYCIYFVILKEHIFWLKISVDQSNLMQLLHLQTDLVKHISNPIILKKTKTSAVFPNFIFTFEHFRQKIQIYSIFKSCN